MGKGKRGKGRMKGLGGGGSFGKGRDVICFARVFPIMSTPSCTGFFRACAISPIPAISSIPNATSLILLYIFSCG